MVMCSGHVCGAFVVVSYRRLPCSLHLGRSRRPPHSAGQPASQPARRAACESAYDGARNASSVLCNAGSPLAPDHPAPLPPSWASRHRPPSLSLRLTRANLHRRHPNAEFTHARARPAPRARARRPARPRGRAPARPARPFPRARRPSRGAGPRARPPLLLQTLHRPSCSRRWACGPRRCGQDRGRGRGRGRGASKWWSWRC